MLSKMKQGSCKALQPFLFKSPSIDPDLFLSADIFPEYRMLLALNNFPFPGAKESETVLERKW